MKKSSLFIILALLILVVVLTAANVKLKQEYTKGNYSNTIVKTILPPFSYIKEEIENNNGINYQYPITLQYSDSNYVAIDTSRPSIFSFSVKDDTLFITRKENITEETRRYNFEATLAVRNMRYLAASKASFNINNWKADSLSVKATDYSHINFSRAHIQNLAVMAKNKARIDIAATDSLPSLQLALGDISAFTADDVIITRRDLSLANTARLNLSGKSIASFGIK